MSNFLAKLSAFLRNKRYCFWFVRRVLIANSSSFLSKLMTKPALNFSMSSAVDGIGVVITGKPHARYSLIFIESP